MYSRLSHTGQRRTACLSARSASRRGKSRGIEDNRPSSEAVRALQQKMDERPAPSVLSSVPGYRAGQSSPASSVAQGKGVAQRWISVEELGGEDDNTDLKIRGKLETYIKENGLEKTSEMEEFFSIWLKCPEFKKFKTIKELYQALCDEVKKEQEKETESPAEIASDFMSVTGKYPESLKLRFAGSEIENRKEEESVTSRVSETEEEYSDWITSIYIKNKEEVLKANPEKKQDYEEFMKSLLLTLRVKKNAKEFVLEIIRRANRMILNGDVILAQSEELTDEACDRIVESVLSEKMGSIDLGEGAFLLDKQKGGDLTGNELDRQARIIMDKLNEVLGFFTPGGLIDKLEGLGIKNYKQLNGTVLQLLSQGDIQSSDPVQKIWNAIVAGREKSLKLPEGSAAEVKKEKKIGETILGPNVNENFEYGEETSTHVGFEVEGGFSFRFEYVSLAFVQELESLVNKTLATYSVAKGLLTGGKEKEKIEVLQMLVDDIKVKELKGKEIYDALLDDIDKKMNLRKQAMQAKIDKMRDAEVLKALLGNKKGNEAKRIKQMRGKDRRVLLFNSQGLEGKREEKIAGLKKMDKNARIKEFITAKKASGIYCVSAQVEFRTKPLDINYIGTGLSTIIREAISLFKSEWLRKTGSYEWKDKSWKVDVCCNFPKKYEENIGSATMPRLAQHVTISIEPDAFCKMSPENQARLVPYLKECGSRQAIFERMAGFVCSCGKDKANVIDASTEGRNDAGNLLKLCNRRSGICFKTPLEVMAAVYEDLNYDNIDGIKELEGSNPAKQIPGPGVKKEAKKTEAMGKKTMNMLEYASVGEGFMYKLCDFRRAVRFIRFRGNFPVIQGEDSVASGVISNSRPQQGYRVVAEKLQPLLLDLKSGVPRILVEHRSSGDGGLVDAINDALNGKTTESGKLNLKEVKDAFAEMDLKVNKLNKLLPGDKEKVEKGGMQQLIDPREDFKKGHSLAAVNKFAEVLAKSEQKKRMERDKQIKKDVKKEEKKEGKKEGKQGRKTQGTVKPFRK